jgi:hypothetical protein
MWSRRRTSGLSLIFSAAFAVALANGTVLAADNSPRPPGSVPVKKSKLRTAISTTTELSPSALGMDTGSRGYEPGDQKPDMKMPDQFQLGNNTLHIDAEKKDPTPPVGLESNGQAVINKAPNEPALAPSYLGLRLTTPMSLFSR